MSFSVSQFGTQGNSYITTYLDLLHQNKIDVLYDPKAGFSADVHHLDSEGRIVSTTAALPLQGLPKGIMQIKNVAEIKEFFRETYLVPERGSEGLYNRVSVHVTGLGGGKFKIPFQPGLALGSIVKGETLDKLEEYAKSEARNEAFEEQVKGAQQRIEVLQGKIASRESSLPSTQNASTSTSTSTQNTSIKKEDPLVSLWNQQIASLNKMLQNLAEKIKTEGQKQNSSPIPDIPIFEGFHQGIESPIDMGRSHLQVQPRGFDTLSYSSQYIDMKQTLSEIDDQVKHSSSANDVSISGKAWMVKGKVSHAWSEATSERLAQIKQENIAKGILMINAMVTTRHVRSFSDIHYDKAKLKSILELMRSGSAESLDRYGITTRQEGQKSVKEIYLLTEAVLGGAFTALVIFLDEEKKKRTIDKKAEEEGHTTSASLRGKHLFVKGSVGFSHSDHQGSQSEEDLLHSISNTNISIEINAQGGIPIFTRDVIEHEMMQHLDLNPAKFELSPQDEAEAENFDRSSEKEKRVAAYKRQMRMENAQVAIMNTYRGLTTVKDKQTVHTAKSVMEAYENFANKIVSDPDCGIPLGFNYQILTEKRLQEILKELEGTTPSSQQPPKQGAQASQQPPKQVAEASQQPPKEAAEETPLEENP